MSSEQEMLERAIRDAQAGRVGQAAPQPIQMIFPAYSVDITRGTDGNGRDVTSLSVTSANGTMMVILPMPSMPAPGELRSAPVLLAMELLKASGWEAVYRGNGDGVTEEG